MSCGFMCLNFVGCFCWYILVLILSLFCRILFVRSWWLSGLSWFFVWMIWFLSCLLLNMLRVMRCCFLFICGRWIIFVCNLRCKCILVMVLNMLVKLVGSFILFCWCGCCMFWMCCLWLRGC